MGLGVVKVTGGNKEMNPRKSGYLGGVLENIATPVADGKALLEKAMVEFRLSMRGYTRILRVARTIADLDNFEHVLVRHAAEAISYRRMQHINNMQRVG